MSPKDKLRSELDSCYKMISKVQAEIAAYPEDGDPEELKFLKGDLKMLDWNRRCILEEMMDSEE